jgi:hypothetical protein
MRAIIVLVVLLTGCKTTELAVYYPAAGLQIVAKVETREPQPGQLERSDEQEQITALPKVDAAERR